jgi:putative hydrolase of the HAD superfamily
VSVDVRNTTRPGAEATDALALPPNLRAILVDADDTLWENNLFFLQSLDWLCGVGRSLGFSHRATMSIMNRWERRNIRLRGYGYASFEASMVSTIGQLCAGSASGAARHAGLRQQALHWVRFLRRHPIVLLRGVGEVLPRLVARFPVIVVTKGDQRDQMAKVVRSGLLPIFHAVEVVPEKYPANYLAVLAKHRLAPDEVVMVGNSPISDINNPKRAGIATIYIPHPMTWHMELSPISPEGPPTMHVPDFVALGELLDGARTNQ